MKARKKRLPSIVPPEPINEILSVKLKPVKRDSLEKPKLDNAKEGELKVRVGQYVSQSVGFVLWIKT